MRLCWLLSSQKFGLVVIVLALLTAGAFIIRDTLVSGSGSLDSEQSQLNNKCTDSSDYDADCDVDRDGRINVVDLSLIARHLGQTGDPTRFPGIPVGSVVAWLSALPNVPSLPEGWVECNGQVLDDPESPFDGQLIPNLNGADGEAQRFLRGSTSSGNDGGVETHRHGIPRGDHDSNGTGGSGDDLSGCCTDHAENLPPFYEVTWIMRVK